jgi:putative methyltransferase (TIGR04325 family)
MIPIGLADVMPPVLMRWLRRRQAEPIHSVFGDYANWEAALSVSAPYETDFDAYGAITEQVRCGERRSEGTHFMPILCGILLGGGKILDYGGSLGFIYFQAARVVPSRIEWWRVVDLPKVVEYGNAHFADGKLQFFDSTEKALGGQRPDVIVCSHMLQYLVDPYSTLKSLLEIRAETLIVNELPVAAKGRFAVQRLHPILGGTTRPVQILCEAKLQEATAGYEMITEINLPAWAPFPGVRHVSQIYKRKES